MIHERKYPKNFAGGKGKSNPAWGEDFEVGRAGSNFAGSKGAGRNSSGKSWIAKIGMGKKGPGPVKARDQKVPHAGVVRKGAGSMAASGVVKGSGKASHMADPVAHAGKSKSATHGGAANPLNNS